MAAIRWQKLVHSSRNPDNIKSRSFVCGHCGNDVASGTGYYGIAPTENTVIANIYICHRCQSPTYFSPEGKQTPGSAFGGVVSGIPYEEVESLYNEARDCMKVSAYTAAVMCCRKLLMNVAVDQGANKNKTSAYYVNYLAEQGYLPPNGEMWADHIRGKGNDANHEISTMGEEDAKVLIEFSEMMLKFIYEYPARMEGRAQTIETKANEP